MHILSQQAGKHSEPSSMPFNTIKISTDAERLGARRCGQTLPFTSVYMCVCVTAWNRLVMSDKGRGGGQDGRPAGVCQCPVNSELSDRDFSWHSPHSCSWRSDYKLAGCSDAMRTEAATWLRTVLQNTTAQYGGRFVPQHLKRWIIQILLCKSPSYCH